MVRLAWEDRNRSHRIRQYHFGHCASLWWRALTPGGGRGGLLVWQLGRVQRTRRLLGQNRGPPWPDGGTEWYMSNESTAVISATRASGLGR
jgi:hypothetical protein